MDDESLIHPSFPPKGEERPAYKGSGLNLDPDKQSDQIEDRRNDPPYKPSLLDKLKQAYPTPWKK